MKLTYGQRLIKIKKHNRQWPQMVYVVSKDDDYLVKLSTRWPYVPGIDPKFFMNITQIPRVYRPAEQGEQMTLGSSFEKPDQLKRLRDKHLK